ncbi:MULTISPECIES: flagellar hook-associated protein 3 [Pseudomonas]|jgi:flagellar hook-associated protein 3 FlgL|uniref:flagellar hook-associated protein 3 n=1 Tax=Pseudomonas TaxID=286 RepID=UPI0005ABFB87|nr:MULTISPECIES: flagellar hook-associated protein 3 [Pseudomonas]MBD8738145.1 flagellar hook-associated protein 3 [Pseudomonas fluorescens]AJP53638.1 flagellar hook-associated protein FlgL [Pseudomonas simiae]AJZ95014.1 flagellar hook-associated protein FlgL [Pseudomonas simiae]KIQ08800.1 flagellar hook protein FlgL [Pseudomonas simiae]MBI6612445.1 flagellar hook-associated protein 3 [Pseudomonas simiae]
MRISTAQYFETTSAKYSDNYSSVVKAQNQASTGVRVETASDDPVAAARLLMLQQQKDMLSQFNGNITSLKNSLTNEESVLGSINDALQKASELALRAGGSLSDADRKSIAGEIGAIEDQVLGLLNSKDASGNYLFSGSKTATPPYSRNSDGTYTYQGDETPLSLQVSDTLKIQAGDTGKSIMGGAANSGRTQATWIAPPIVPPATAPVPNDNKVSLSAGLVTSGTDYTKQFADGQPYKLTFTSSTQYKVSDKNGNDITSEIPGNGTFDSTKEGGSSVNLRGVKFDITLDLKDVASGPNADALVKDRSFSLAAKPDTFSVSRTPSNPSTAQLTNASVTNQAAYASTFPANSGAVIKFTSGTAYEVYAQPYTADSKAIATGDTGGGTTVTAAGVTFDVSGTPQSGDQFAVAATTQKTQNALDTLSQLRHALEQPADGNPAAMIKLKDALDASIANFGNTRTQVDNVRGSIGARQNALDIQTSENTSIGLANTSTMSDLGNIDTAQAAINLTLQQTMLQASQLAFVKISQLSLFNKM